MGIHAPALAATLLLLVACVAGGESAAKLNADLHDAAYLGDTAKVEAALAAGANIEALNNWQETPLLVACEHSHEQAAELLIHKGANIEARNNHTSTPIMRAAMKGEVSQFIHASSSRRIACRAGCLRFPEPFF